MRLGVPLAAVAVGLAALLTAGTAPSSALRTTPTIQQTKQAQQGNPDFVRSVLTDDTSRLRIASRDSEVAIRATSARPGDAHWNRRELFRRPNAQVSTDHTSCATWVSESDALAQQGLAIRIRDGRPGRVRAVTLTKNTVFNVSWVFNIVTWDTARAEPWRGVGQFDLDEALVDDDGVLRPFPWRVCLRGSGAAVSFKVWLPDEMPQPSWTDPVYARTTTVPRGFTVAGRPGWYVGHVPADGSVVYGDLSTTRR